MFVAVSQYGLDCFHGITYRRIIARRGTQVKAISNAGKDAVRRSKAGLGNGRGRTRTCGFFLVREAL